MGSNLLENIEKDESDDSIIDKAPDSDELLKNIKSSNKKLKFDKNINFRNCKVEGHFLNNLPHAKCKITEMSG